MDRAKLRRRILQAAAYVLMAMSSFAFAQATGNPYKIAVLASLTGPLAGLGVPSRAALELEAKRLNDAGGIHGRPIHLVFGDDLSDPSKGVIAFKRLLDEEPVAMIGPNFSSTALGIIPLVERAKLPMISMAAEDAQVQSGRKYVFMISLTSHLNASANLSYMRSLGLKRIALLHDTGAYGHGGAALVKKLSSNYGVSVVHTETFNLSDTDMTPQLTKIKNDEKVQAILLWAAGAAPAIVTRQYRSLNFSVPLLLTGAQADPGFVKAAGTAAEGIPFPTARSVLQEYLPADNPSRKALDAFVPAYRQATGVEPNIFAAVAYDALHLVASALRMAPGAEPEKIVAALESLRFSGVNGEYAFARDRHAGMLPSSVAMAMWKGGRIVPGTPNCEGCFATVQPR